MTVPYAIGSALARWPLPWTKPNADVRDSREFGAPRKKGQRVHTGIDLGSQQGEPVIAPEAGVIVRIQGPTWVGEIPSSAVLLATDTGIVIVLGEVDPTTVRVAKGERVKAGTPIGEVGVTKMLHFETYTGGTTQTAQWLAGNPPPTNLLDPTAYLQVAATVSTGKPVPQLPSWSAIQQAIASKAATIWPGSSPSTENRTPPSSAAYENQTDGGGGGVLLLLGLALVAVGSRS
jgi:murein DD-endopeptidase MepM/ murein hydrolase activator NlpD